MTKPRQLSKTALKRKEAERALNHARRAMKAAGMGEEEIDGFVRQVDDNCAGPCKSSTQAYGSIIWALTDALTDAWGELGDERSQVSE